MSSTVIGVRFFLSSRKGRVHRVREDVGSEHAIFGLWELLLLMVSYTEARLPGLGKPLRNKTESRRLSN